MKKFLFASIISLIFLFASNIPASAQEENSALRPTKLTRILFVFDASQSMAGTWDSDLKINIARQILIDLIDSLQYVENVELALRVYGHQSPVPPQDCSDTKLEVPFGPNTASRIRQKLRFITPKGTTPIANSLAASVNDFPECENCRNIIVLITDGIEACDGDPCMVSQELQKQGIVLKPFVIGIGLDPGFRETFDCVGYYYNALEEMEFKETLGYVINQVLNSTTAQVNLLDENGKPTESDVNMTFYDTYSGRLIYNYIHTLNHKGNPDTLELDHLITYRLKVHTIPPREVDSIKIIPGKHSIIPVNAPQGYLKVKTNRGNEYEGLDIIVREAGKCETLNLQLMNQVGKYIKGHYELELLTIPRIVIKEVEILQSHTTIIEIPRPGNIIFNYKTTGFGSIYKLTNKEQEWVMNLNPALRQQNYLMQPGQYRVVFKPSSLKSSMQTHAQNFEVVPGGNLLIELY